MSGRTWGVTIAAAIAFVPFVGCSERPAAVAATAPIPADGARAELVDRISALQLGVAAAGAMTPALAREVQRLQRDIERWQARTGRHDIVVVTGRHGGSPPGPAGERTTPAFRRRDPTLCGGACVPFYTRDGWHCFLADWDCTGGVPSCTYTCVYVAPQRT
jgi:hypothetical protein